LPLFLDSFSTDSDGKSKFPNAQMPNSWLLVLWAMSKMSKTSQTYFWSKLYTYADFAWFRDISLPQFGRIHILSYLHHQAAAWVKSPIAPHGLTSEQTSKTLQQHDTWTWTVLAITMLVWVCIIIMRPNKMDGLGALPNLETHPKTFPAISQ